MPPKRIKIDLAGQKTLMSFIKSQNCENVNEKTDCSTSMTTVESRPRLTDESNTESVSIAESDKSVTENDNNTTGGNPTERKYHAKWEKLFSWLFYERGKMYCKLCIKHGRRNTFTEGCTNFKSCGLKRHDESKDHVDCVKAGKLKKDLDVVINKAMCEEDEAMLKASKVVYWLVTENIPLSKYESLLNLVKDLGVTKLDALRVNDRVGYKSYYSANELLSAISDQIDGDISKQIADSPFITILADESTDIVNKKRMTIHARIIDPLTSIPSTVYLCNRQYEDGTGEGSANEICKELNRRNVPPNKLIGFGSDGASVMSGDGKGVKGRLKEKNPHLLHVHCMAHRLALCTSQAAEGMAVLKKYQDWLTQLFYYLRASGTRERELHRVQEVLDHPVLKYKEIHAVRWLSCYEAVEAVFRTLDPLMTYFHQRDAAKDPKAKGLLKTMATTQFIFITYLMMDVLPVVSKLCLNFQKEDLDVAKAKVSLDQCLADLVAYRDGKQPFTTHVGRYDNLVKTGPDGHFEFESHILTSSNANFTSLKSQFVNRLISNINQRFPQQSLMNSFFVLAMRTINYESSPDEFGNEEIDAILKHFGEQQVLCLPPERQQL